MQCIVCEKDLYGPVKYCDTCDLPVCDDCVLPVYGYYAEHYKVDVTSYICKNCVELIGRSYGSG